MQLIPEGRSQSSLRIQIGAAVLAVLAATQAQATAPTAESTEFDSALLQYQENGGRISTTEAVVHVKWNHADGSTFGIGLTFDTLSGGSPNGALPSKAVQTFAKPSGTSLSTTTVNTPVQTVTTASGRLVSSGGGSSTSGPYTVAPGELPIDKSFKDMREAANLSWSYQLDPLTTHTLGAGYSHEADFQSMLFNTAVSHDFNDKNTTLSAGVNFEYDAIAPIGGAPVPMSEYKLFQKEGHKSKRVEDLLLGVSQVMGRRWITQVNLSLDKSNGYQNDPYKILSGLDDTGKLVDYLYEKRPEDRSRTSVYWGNKIALDHDSIDFSVRHMTDTWGITSKTVDLRYRWLFTDGSYFEPQFRYYKQSAADFYRLYLPQVLQGAPLLAYASADPRLAQFNASTVGFKWATKLDRSTEFSLRAQTYVQRGNTPATVPTALQGLDLYPSLKTVLFQVGLKTEF
jgi:hypothetical protein